MIEAAEVLPRQRTRLARPRLTGRRLFRAALLLLAFAILATGLFAGQVAPHDYTGVNLSAALKAPQWTHYPVLGTDDVGRDLLSRIIWGIRSSVLVALVAVLISGLLGTAVGGLAGYFPGVTGTLLMRFVDLMISIPGIVLIVFLAFLIGPGLKTTMVILGATGWLPYARLVRAELLVIREQQFMQAAMSVGASPLRCLVRHALPHVVGTITVLSTVQFGAAMLAESGVSFLGFGIQPPGSSLGLLIANGRQFLTTAWWLVFCPAAVLFAMIFLANLLGDELSEMLDPVKRRSRG